MKLIFIFLFVCYTQTVLAKRPSFDCKKASTKVERTICTHDILSEQDLDLTKAYSEAKKAGNDSLTDQREWIKKREDCGSNFECIYNKTRQRIINLLQLSFTPESKKFLSDDPADNDIKAGFEILNSCRNFSSEMAIQCKNGKEIGFKTCHLARISENLIENIIIDQSPDAVFNKMCKWSGKLDLTAYKGKTEDGDFIFDARNDGVKAKLSINLLDGISLKMLETRPKPTTKTTSSKNSSNSSNNNSYQFETDYTVVCRNRKLMDADDWRRIPLGSCTGEIYACENKIKEQIKSEFGSLGGICKKSYGKEYTFEHINHN